MANKKISELSSRTPTLTDLMLVGDPSSGYSYKTTVNDVALEVQNIIGGTYVTLATAQTISGAKTFSNVLTLTSVANAPTAGSKFLILNASNVVNYRTAAEVLSDIGAQAAGSYVPTSRTLTINGTAFDLSANRSWSVGTVTSVAATAGTGISITGSPITSSGTLTITNTAPDQTVVLTSGTGINVTGTYPSFTIAATNSGTVTSVALATGTTGTDISVSGSPITSSGTITLNIPTASATNRGALSSTDWSTFNNKQGAITLTTTGSSGAATFVANTLNIPNYTLSGLGGVPTSRTLTINGTAFDLSADRSWSVGTVTSVAALTLGTTGTDLSSSVATGTTTPVITLNVPTASATNRGALSSTDWTTFNNKQNAITLTTTGTSGEATLVGSTLNIPQYQAALTNPVTGTGTLNYFPRFSASGTIANSTITTNSDGSIITLTGATSPDGPTLSFKAGTGITVSGAGYNSLGFTTQSTSDYFVLATSNLKTAVFDFTSITANTSKTYTLPNASGTIALTSNIPTVSGTTNYIPKFTGASAIGNSQVRDDGAGVSIGIAPQTDKLFIYNASGTNTGLTVQQDGTGDIVRFNGNSGANRLALTQGGNLGLGVTPSAWGANYKALQIGTAGNSVYETNSLFTINNAYNDGTNWKYQTTHYAAVYEINKGIGAHIWYIAPSGTAGNNISFTQAMTLDASGRLGINTTSPGSYDTDADNLVVGTTSGNNGITIASVSTGVGNLFFADGTSVAADKYVGFIQYDHSTNAFRFGTNASERMRITSGGNVGIGTTSPAVLGGFTTLAINGSTGGLFDLMTGGTTYGRLYSITSNLIVEAVGASNIQFATNSAERMRITSGGNVGIGTTSPASPLSLSGSGDVGIRIKGGAANLSYIDFDDADSGTPNGSIAYNHSSNFMNFATGGSNAERMRITSAGEVYIAGTTDQGAYNLQVNGTGVWGAGAYVNGSDIRLKENIKELDNSLELVKKMRPVTYSYKSSYSKDNSIQTGFIAQDLEELLKDKNYLDGIVKKGPEYMNVAYQNLIPLLVKAIQELTNKIENKN